MCSSDLKRVAEMNAADAEQAKKDAIANAKAKRREEEINEIILVVGVVLVVIVTLGVVGYNAWDFCQTNRCGR